MDCDPPDFSRDLLGHHRQVRVSQKSDTKKGRGRLTPPPLGDPRLRGGDSLSALRPTSDSAEAEGGDGGRAQGDQQADQAG